FRTQWDLSGEKDEIISNYLTGELKKEALEPGQWSYNASTKFFITGNAAGNFQLDAHIGKDISRKIGSLEVGFEQRLGNAPYSYTVYGNQYFRTSKTYNKESVTRLYGMINNDFLKLNAGLRNYIITNYIYINQDLEFTQ